MTISRMKNEKKVRRNLITVAIIPFSFERIIIFSFVLLGCCSLERAFARFLNVLL